jgi:hypothetical protein
MSHELNALDYAGGAPSTMNYAPWKVKSTSKKNKATWTSSESQSAVFICLFVCVCVFGFSLWL